MWYTALSINPHRAAHGANVLPDLGADEFRVTPSSGALDQNSHHLAGRIVVLITRTRLIDDRILRHDDLVMTRMKKGAGQYVLWGMRARDLRQESGPHIEQVANQYLRAQRIAFPFGDKISDRLVERSDLAEQDGSANSCDRDRLGQGKRIDRHGARLIAKIVFRFNFPITPNNQSVGIVGSGKS